MTNRQKVFSIVVSTLLGTGIGWMSVNGAKVMNPGNEAQMLAILSVVCFGLVAITVALMGHRVSASLAMALAIVAGVHHMTNQTSHASVFEQAYPSLNGAAASIPRQWDGHFRAGTLVNGRPVEMLVDTGASLVLLTWEDAEAAGIDMDALSFTAPILTANGRSHVATIDLASVTIGGVGATGVRGAVAKPGMLHASLLGMSYLGAIEEAAIRKDRLILRN